MSFAADLTQLPFRPVALCGMILCAATLHAGVVLDPYDTTQGALISFTVGANTFYDQGYFGTNAVIANVEAGHIWNGHETLTGVTTYVNDPSIDRPPAQQPPAYQFDSHATMVGFLLGGLGPANAQGQYYYSQMGLAPASKLYSTAIATDWPDSSGTFNASALTQTYAYQTVMQTGVTYLAPWGPGISVEVQNRKADVINSSWGYADPAGNDASTRMIDALAYQNHQTVVMAAGNHLATPTPQVIGPASGYNTIAVGALKADWSNPQNPVYNQVADFSNAGPNNFFNPQTQTTVPGVRAKVDIVAPGADYQLPAYLGPTGGQIFGAAAALEYGAYANNLYASEMQGTSFASPVVAGGAALLVDVGYANSATYGPHSVDGRVIKAVLLNSADKLPGWNNGQTLTNGVIKTSQSLDYAMGAGGLNLTRAYGQYTAGTTDVPGTGGGVISPTGWDFGQVAQGSPNDYVIAELLTHGSLFTTTLNWFVNREYSLDPNTQIGIGTDVQFSNLDLQVWESLGGSPLRLVAESDSLYNNVQHLNFTVPDDGQYIIRVFWNGEQYGPVDTATHADEYALAWSVQTPEPAAIMMLMLGAAPLLRRKRLPIPTPLPRRGRCRRGDLGPVS